MMWQVYFDFSGAPNTYYLRVDCLGKEVSVPAVVWDRVKLGLDTLSKCNLGLSEIVDLKSGTDEVVGVRITIPAALTRREKSNFKAQAEALLLFHLYPEKFGFAVQPDN